MSVCFSTLLNITFSAHMLIIAIITMPAITLSKSKYHCAIQINLPNPPKVTTNISEPIKERHAEPNPILIPVIICGNAEGRTTSKIILDLLNPKFLETNITNHIVSLVNPKSKITNGIHANDGTGYITDKRG